MPDYEICYLKSGGTPCGKFTIACHDDREAKVLSHALMPPGTKSFEVWSGAMLVYQRPLHYGPRDLHAASPPTHALYAAG